MMSIGAIIPIVTRFIDRSNQDSRFGNVADERLQLYCTARIEAYLKAFCGRSVFSCSEYEMYTINVAYYISWHRLQFQQIRVVVAMLALAATICNIIMEEKGRMKKKSLYEIYTMMSCPYHTRARLQFNFN